MSAISIRGIVFIFVLVNLQSYTCWGWGGGNRRQEPEEKKDLYKLLELTKKASKDEIKKQYKKLTRKYHPDKNPDTKDLFVEINEAYEILSDPKKRRVYDTKGYAAAKKAGTQQESAGDDMDIFSRFFGGGMRRENKMDDFKVKLKVSLNDLYNGKEMEFKYTRNVICPHCRGIGADSEEDIHKCQQCNGQGVILQRREIAPGYVQQFQQQCPKCQGKGNVIKKQCHVCKGYKIVPTIEELNLFVEKGMTNGQEIVSTYYSIRFMKILLMNQLIKIQET